MLLTCLQRQGFLLFSKAQHFSPVVLLNLQKGASPESPVDCALLHWCSTCFLLKMHSRPCFCFGRRKKYSFFLDRLSSKLNALGSPGTAFMFDNTFNIRSHLQTSHSVNIIFLNPQSLTHNFHFPSQPNNGRTISSFSCSLTLLSIAFEADVNDIKGFNEPLPLKEWMENLFKKAFIIYPNTKLQSILQFTHCL